MSNLEKVKFVGQLFCDGAKAQAVDEGTLTIAGVVGLMQGLKYNGSLNRGVKGAAAYMGVMMTANGIIHVMKNWNIVKSL